MYFDLVIIRMLDDPWTVKFYMSLFHRRATNQSVIKIEVKHDVYDKRQTAGRRLPFALCRFEFLRFSFAYTRKLTLTF